MLLRLVDRFLALRSVIKITYIIIIHCALFCTFSVFHSSFDIDTTFTYGLFNELSLSAISIYFILVLYQLFIKEKTSSKTFVGAYVIIAILFVLVNVIPRYGTFDPFWGFGYENNFGFPLFYLSYDSFDLPFSRTKRILIEPSNYFLNLYFFASAFSCFSIFHKYIREKRKGSKT